MCMSKPDTPKVPPPPPQLRDPQVRAARDRARQKAGEGKQQTLLTGPLGVSGSASTTANTLLSGD